MRPERLEIGLFASTHPVMTAEGVSLPIRAIAAMLGRHPRTVRRWIDRGAFPAFRGPGGQLQVRPADVRRFLNENRVAVWESDREWARRKVAAEREREA